MSHFAIFALQNTRFLLVFLVFSLVYQKKVVPLHARCAKLVRRVRYALSFMARLLRAKIMN